MWECSSCLSIRWKLAKDESIRLVKTILAEGVLVRESTTQHTNREELLLTDQELLEVAELWVRLKPLSSMFWRDKLEASEHANSPLAVRLQDLSRIAIGRDLFMTDTSKLGLGDWSVRPGDEVWILHGSRTPVILRRTGHGSYNFLRQCYLEDAMHGEVMHCDWRERKRDYILE